MKPAQTTGFVTAFNPRLNRYHVGIVTDDGRCRVDTQADETLEELTFWETRWEDPTNPWLGGWIFDRQITHLRPDYT